MTATIINVAYVWKDQLDLVQHGRIAVADKRLTVDEFDDLLNREDVFYIFEPGERPMSDLFEFKIVAMEGVV